MAAANIRATEQSVHGDSAFTTETGPKVLIGISGVPSLLIASWST